MLMATLIYQRSGRDAITVHENPFPISDGDSYLFPNPSFPKPLDFVLSFYAPE